MEDDIKVVAPDQLEHISKPIESEHIFGKKSAQAKPMHADTKMVQTNFMPKFANNAKIKSLIRKPKV